MHDVVGGEAVMVGKSHWLNVLTVLFEVFLHMLWRSDTCEQQYILLFERPQGTFFFRVKRF